MPTLAINKRARFDYDISETYEAGLSLKGYEVKSVKNGHISLRGSYVSIRSLHGSPEVYLVGAHISLYPQAGKVDDYLPTRERKLLLGRREISRLIGKRQETGLTLVPLKIYTKHSFVKLELGIGRGRQKTDKREVIKKRETERQISTLTKRKTGDARHRQ
ncbi:MAG: SsrA-binding protein SmpB [Candidatus Falkowbacteria bacterium]|nr:SsrA-binding protein SmpB [Candidatus Falkowbacteria bacterium]